MAKFVIDQKMQVLNRSTSNTDSTDIELFASISGATIPLEYQQKRISLWLPNVKQPIAALRHLLRAKISASHKHRERKQCKLPLKQVSSSSSSSCVRIFFNGHELEDTYSIADYELQNGNVIQVKIEEEPQNMVTSKIDANLAKEEKVIFDSAKVQPQIEVPFAIENDAYYCIGDHIDAVDQLSGAWCPARISSIVEPECTYMVSFRKPSLGLAVRLALHQIRPQSYEPLALAHLYPGLAVFAYLEDQRSWFAALVERIQRCARSGAKIWLDLVRGEPTRSQSNIANQQQTPIIEQLLVKYRPDNFRKLEKNTLQTMQDSTLRNVIQNGAQIERFYTPDCGECGDDAQIERCKSCGCQVCFAKNFPEQQLVCDECDRATHRWCLVASRLKEEEENDEEEQWFCDHCRNESSEEVIRAHKLYLDSKRILKTAKKKKGPNEARKRSTTTAAAGQSWGFGMSLSSAKIFTRHQTVGEQNISAKFGPIQDIPVGAWWRFRSQASAAGVHAPLVAGIHGRQNVGAFSIVISAIYPEDIDLGNEIYFSAIGGRRNGDGARRRADYQLIGDQFLRKTNRALALNCAAAFDDQRGADAGADWRQGNPVRVVRSGNGRRSRNGGASSRYAPKIGIRYDGLYKVVKYWPEQTNEEEGRWRIWRFLLRRDDPAPAPWTEAGRYRARKLGFDRGPAYPERWSAQIACKRQLKLDLRFLARKEKREIEKKKAILSAKTSAVTSNLDTEIQFEIPANIRRLIDSDLLNQQIWRNLLSEWKPAWNKTIFFDRLRDIFVCGICFDSFANEDGPVFAAASANSVITLECSHSFCRDCIVRAAQESCATRCPVCRAIVNLSKLKSNLIFIQIIIELYKCK